MPKDLCRASSGELLDPQGKIVRDQREGDLNQDQRHDHPMKELRKEPQRRGEFLTAMQQA